MSHYNSQFKTKNCRTLYQTKHCMYGERCMFRHEHRNFKQVHRHYYTPHLYILETFFASAVCKRRFLETHEPTTSRLPVFREIHAFYDARKATQLALTQESSEGELSDIEMSAEVIKSAAFACIGEKFGENEQISASFLNTSQDSASDDSQIKFALKVAHSPATIAINADGDDQGSDSDEEMAELSPRSLGLDFV